MAPFRAPSRPLACLLVAVATLFSGERARGDVAAAGASGENDSGKSECIKANPATVSRNDVLYVTPSVEPWEAMPVGGGDLSAMVRSDGAGLDLHLTKSDAWGYQAPPDAPPGSRFFNNVSPGHVRIEFGRRARAAAEERFRQRLDLYRGRIVIRFGRDPDGPRLEIWGHPERKILVVEVIDPRGLLEPATVRLSEWRASMNVGASNATIHAAEVHQRPARPHLANTGMEHFFDAKSDPLLGRGTAVALGAGSVRPKTCSAEAKNATMLFPEQCPPRYHLVIAAAVTTDGDPLAAARRELDAALAVPLATLDAEQQAWWRDYWSKSLLRIESPDKMANRLSAAYHVHLYTLGCTNRGPVPCKWDGGAGLMRGDERTWGLSEWVQEIRFTYLPLYAANRLEMARGLSRHYSQMRPYLLEQTKRVWGVDGLWIPETVLPWGHAEDFVLKTSDKVRAEHFLHWNPSTAPYGKFERYNGYVGFLFTAGLEICHHYLTYYRYSGDERFLRKEAYPMIRDVCRFLSGLLRKGADGRWHLDPANAVETWWMVRDPADTLAGIEAVFPEFVRLSEQYGQDADLRTKCEEILAALPEPSLGHWARDGTIDAAAKTYAPAAAKEQFPTARNSEIPALYRVFPFGLSGIGGPDYELALGTFERRIFGITNSWSMDAIWAARLGLGEEACKLLGEHAVRYNRFRYGGWDSSNSSVFPDGLSVVPYTDGAGLSAFGLNEVLLQSHNGLIRVLPAVAKDWSGVFRLRAEGGFLVAAEFADASPRRVEIQSLLGKKCRVENPWGDTCVVRAGGRVVTRGEDSVIEFDTRAGHVYLLTPAGRPLSDYMLVINEDNSHFFGTRKPEEMTLAGLHAFVDQYAGSAVTHLFLCPNAMRASFRSRSRDAIWDPVGSKEPDGLWPQNAKRLFEAGLDPYEVWISRCREKGVSPWLSMRMNDVHSVDEPDNFMHSSFWRAHPEYWRVPNGSAGPWVNRAMNYAHAAVREHEMAFVRELLERYDPDGLELDWMRFGYHLTPGREREESGILTDFVREVRSMTAEWSKKRGHPILLAVRAPAHPNAAAGLGMDAVLWAREGLVDMIVPCPFFTSSDFDIPVELWHERLGEAAERVTVAPGIEYNARPWPGGAAVANDLASLRGFAASAYHRGADSLYLFNWMDSQTRPVTESAYTVLLRDGLSRQTVSGAPRRHLVCFRDTVPPGFPSGVQLPADARRGAGFRIHVGPKPESGKVWAVAGLVQRDGVSEASFEASLNGQALGTAENVADLHGFGGGTERAVRFLCPLDAVKDGYNSLSLRQVDGAVAQQIVWVEMRIEPK